MINTAAVQTGFEDDGAGGETSLGGAFNQGLQVEVDHRTVVVKARDFTTGTWLKQRTIPLHNTW